MENCKKRTVEDFLKEIISQGIKLWFEDEKLKFKIPVGINKKEIIDELKDKKKEIIKILKNINFEKEKIERAPIDKKNLLSYSQQSLWILDRVNQGSSVYNILNVLRIKGNLKVDLLENAVNIATKRHDSLRMYFKELEGEARQFILDEKKVKIDLINILNEKNQEVLVETLLNEEEKRNFDLETGDTFRFKIIQVKEKEFLLIFNIHHIISDAASNWILICEILDYYNKLSQKEYVQYEEMNFQFSDYSYNERKKIMNKDYSQPALEYWKQKLDKLENLELPTDFIRPKLQSYDGNVEKIEISKETLDKLKKLFIQQGVSLYMGLMSIFKILLQRYSRQRDIAVGTVVSLRNKEEWQDLIGNLINTIVLRSDVDTDKTYLEFLKNEKLLTLEAYEYQDIPFDKLLEELQLKRDLSRTPLFQTMFILQNNKELDLNKDDLEIEVLDKGNTMAPFDLRVQMFEKENGLIGDFHYSTNLYKKNTIVRMINNYKNLIEEIIKDSNKRLKDYSILSEKEKEEILVKFNKKQKKIEYKSVYKIFEENAVKFPDKIAVYSNGLEYSYKIINERANQIANYLRENEIRNNDIIAVTAERDVKTLIGILGILKSGAAYVPIDMNYPEDRVKYILEDSRAKILLNCMDDEVKFEFSGKILSYKDERILNLNTENLGKKNDPEDLIYMIYTSGSTGKPKGAAIYHKSFSNLINWYNKEFENGKDDTNYLLTSLSFDLSQKNLFASLCAGGKLCIYSGKYFEPEIISEELHKNSVTWINCTPSMFYRLTDLDDKLENLSTLKYVFLGGEPILLSSMNKWINSLYCNAEIVNTYGPTECTDIASFYRVKKPSEYKDNDVPLGYAIDNVNLYVMNENMKLNPIGVPGELCIGGIGVSKGYIYRKDLTKEKFIENPYVKKEKIYKTGDLVKLDENGKFRFLGRIDKQVKIRGFRIELEEIEAYMKLNSKIQDAAVIAKEENGEKYLSAYYVAIEKMDIADIKQYLEKDLPDYMIPLYFTKVDKIPLNPNGKLDRKALLEVEEIKEEEYDVNDDLVFAGKRILSKRPRPNLSTPYSVAENLVEEEFAKIWEESLGLEKVGVLDDYFDLGGHSLRALELIKKMSKIAPEIQLRELYEYRTIRDLTKHIEKNHEKINVDINVKVEKEVKEEIIKFKILEDIVPGDKVYPIEHVNCFHKPMAMIHSSFDKKYFDLYLFYLNYYMNFVVDGFFKNYLHGEEYPPLPSDDYLEFYKEVLDNKFGLALEKIGFDNEEDMHKKIKKELDQDRAVLFNTDLYYLVYTERYKTEHHTHPIIIKGYNLEKGIYHIFDDQHSTSGYQDFILSFENVYGLRPKCEETSKGYFISLGKKEDFSLKNINYLNALEDLYKSLNLIEKEETTFEFIEEEMILELERSKGIKRCGEMFLRMNFKPVYYDILFKFLNRIDNKNGKLDLLKEQEKLITENWQKLKIVVLSNINEGKYDFSDYKDFIKENKENEILFRKMLLDYFKEVNLIEKVRQDSIKVNKINLFELNSNKAIIEKKENIIRMFLEGSKDYDVWTIRNNAPQVLLSPKNDEKFEFDTKVCQKTQGQFYGSHVGIIMRLDEGKKYMFGITGEKIALFCPEQGNNPSLFEEVYDNKSLDIKVKKEDEFYKFYVKKDKEWEKIYEVMSNSRVKNIGMFTKAIQNEYEVEFSNIKYNNYSQIYTLKDLAGD